MNIVTARLIATNWYNRARMHASAPTVQVSVCPRHFSSGGYIRVHAYMLTKQLECQFLIEAIYDH